MSKDNEGRAEVWPGRLGLLRLSALRSCWLGVFWFETSAGKDRAGAEAEADGRLLPLLPFFFFVIFGMFHSGFRRGGDTRIQSADGMPAGGTQTILAIALSLSLSRFSPCTDLTDLTVGVAQSGSMIYSLRAIIDIIVLGV